MAQNSKSKKLKKAVSEIAPQSVDLNVGGDVNDGVVVVGHGNTIIVHKPDSPSPNYPITNYQLPNYWNLKHPYPMPPHFTGRVDERATLTQWLNDDSENRLFILRALGGFGKSALSWHWLTHDVDDQAWGRVVFWSFYEGDASFDSFIRETLTYLKIEIPQGGRAQTEAALVALRERKILLVMDGFERALRAYNSMNAAYQGDENESPLPSREGQGEGESGDGCANPDAEIFLKSVCALPNLKSKILMTTRLTPRAVKSRGEILQGCNEAELTAMSPADAVEFFGKQKIKGTHTEIESACAPYGYHPLSLHLLARLIVKDFEYPADIRAAQKLKIDGDIKQQKHHVLKVAYESLPPRQAKLLGTIACFRSPVDLKTIDAVAPAPETHADLHDLEERGLLYRSSSLLSNPLLSNPLLSSPFFDLHPIVRRYAYERLTAPEKTATHERLVTYFDAAPQPAKIEKIEDLAPVIELYHHMVKAGKLDEAMDLFYDRIHNPAYYQFGAYQLIAELLQTLFLDGEDKPPRLKKEDDQGWVITVLANSYSMNGQPRRAVPLFLRNAEYDEKNRRKKHLALGLGSVAQQQLVIGALGEAERNLRRSIDLCREIEDEFGEAIGHRELGLTLSYRGAWGEAEQELDKALELAEKQKHVQMQSIIWSYRALRFLLISCATSQLAIDNYQLSIECAVRALELADETARTKYPHPRDYIRAYWLLGAAYRASVVSIRRRSEGVLQDETTPAAYSTTDSVNSTTDQSTTPQSTTPQSTNLLQAEDYLSKAINLCRQINNVEHEADILLELSKLRHAQGAHAESLGLAEEALSITERSGYVLQGADVHLFLAELAMDGYGSKVEGQKSGKEAAIFHAKEALRLATCDGGEFAYKVAYDEAVTMLEKIKG